MAANILTVVEVKIPVSKLKQGMFVCRLDKEWNESAFVFQGFLVNSDELIAKLQEECRYVYIDEKKGIAAPRTLADISSRRSAKPKPKKSFFDKLLGREGNRNRKSAYKLLDIVEQKIIPKEITPPPKLVEFDEEIPMAEQAHSTVGKLIKDYMTHIKRGGTIDLVVAKRTVYDCISSILRSPDAMMLMMRLKNKDYSLWQHSVNVSVLAISFGRYLNLDDDELMLLGLCGLFHDIGKLRISNNALAEAKTKQELQEILNSHTALGQKVLANCIGQLAEVAAEVAHSHHEHLDGSGFPRGLRGAQISAYTRMISIINVYDNLTTGKAGQKALTHYEAMNFLLENAGNRYDETLVDCFNRCVGTYPVGCIVEMSTGEIAVVVEEHETQRLRPKIMLLTDSEKQPIEHKLIELAELEFTNAEESYFIKGIVKAENYGIKLESLPQQLKTSQQNNVETQSIESLP